MGCHCSKRVVGLLGKFGWRWKLNFPSAWYTSKTYYVRVTVNKDYAKAHHTRIAILAFVTWVLFGRGV